MFEGFYFELRNKGVPVSLSEWMTLQHALDENLAEAGLTAFYYLARSVLVKNEAWFDRYDNAFQSFFKGIETPDAMLEEILDGLERVPPLNAEELRMQLSGIPLDELLERFRKLYEEGDFHKHVGGNRAIGTGGTSPTGAFGMHPTGLRIGQGEGRHRSAIKIAEMRRFRNYAPDLVLDTRQIRVALSKLRTLLPHGPQDELDLDTTIDRTCRNAGELELAWKASRKNAVKLLLLMDTGGTMSPHARTVSLLFSAAKSQFQDFQHYYFHNCVYGELWKDIELGKVTPTQEVLNTVGSDYKVIIVGDAYMAPSELTDVNGNISYFSYNDIPGVVWMHRILEKFPAAVWINPDPKRYWHATMSTRIIQRLFPMFEMTLEGLDEAVKALLKTSRPRMTRTELKSMLDGRAYPSAWGN
jgi:uncharacterized protein